MDAGEAGIKARCGRTRTVLVWGEKIRKGLPRCPNIWNTWEANMSGPPKCRS